MHLEHIIDIPTLGKPRKVDLREVAREINESPLPMTITFHEPTEEQCAQGAKLIEQAENEHVLGLVEQAAREV